MANVSPIIREAEGKRLRVAFQRIKLTKRITQADVAAACGWQNASTFNRLLNGKIPLTLDSLTKLAATLGVEPSLISPRLIQSDASGLEAKSPLQLPVSLIKAVSRGSWGEPFLTTFRLGYFTADATAFALTFDRGIAPAGLEGWVVVVEPGQNAVQGDCVIVRHGAGKYSYGRITAIADDGAFSVEVEGRGMVLTTARRCMLVAALCRPADLQDFRACADY